jgi:putative DNA primase/helicase
MQDTKIAIATGLTRRSKTWKNKDIFWSDLVKRLSQSIEKPSTLKEFMQAPKADQDDIKDVGGYVGGYLRGGKRNPENVVHRQLVTLDVDFATTDFFSDFQLLYNNAAFIHATHKHSPLEPRYRLILPLDRECSSDEYVAISRRIAGTLGIERFDNTTFEPNRLMYWPSHPKDVQFYCEEQKGPILSADKILKTYSDWRDTSLWPTADKKLREIGEAAKRQEDPTTKKGVIGAFCRTYPIQDAISQFLSEEYVPAFDGRYTYTGGSTAAGLIVYNDLFAYSHHGTDPAGGKLCNAFDLVRLHKFGHLDKDEKSFKSTSAMEEFAVEDVEVRKTLARENIDSARDMFEDLEVSEEDIEWMSELKIDSKNNYLSSAGNISLILQKDAFLKEAFRQNEFDGKRYITKSVMPWRTANAPEPMRNVDYSGMRNYIECIYGISSQNKIDDALAIEVERLSYHPIRDYLHSLAWDGVPRVDTLLIDYFGVEDNEYTREAIRKMLCGAVARVMRPGVKFDYAMVLVGGQGVGKSTFLRYLGQHWFSDTFLTVHGKEALEQIQGAWIIEMAELSGMRKAEVDAVKHFIAKQRDQFRQAYARVMEIYERQCVFFGTTNNKEFLKDVTGNRRFWPIDVREDLSTKSIFDELPGEVDQIWAEAMQLYSAGEKLILGTEATLIARQQQFAHSESDERRGLIDYYLNKRLPKDWAAMDIYERQDYIQDENAEGVDLRRYVCVAEIWCELFGKRKEEMSRYNTKDLNDIMRSLPDWEESLSTRRFSKYGTQKYYERKMDKTFSDLF